MAHVGKLYPYFFWRDLCGEREQFPVNFPPYYMQWTYFLQSDPSLGAIQQEINATELVSQPLYRTDWEQEMNIVWQYYSDDWGEVMILVTISYDPDERKQRVIARATWDGGEANADSGWIDGTGTLLWGGNTGGFPCVTHDTTDEDAWHWQITFGAANWHWFPAYWSEIPRPFPPP